MTSTVVVKSRRGIFTFARACADVYDGLALTVSAIDKPDFSRDAVFASGDWTHCTVYDECGYPIYWFKPGAEGRQR